MSLPARVAARIGAIFATMLSPDGRRAWALIALEISALVMIGGLVGLLVGVWLA